MEKAGSRLPEAPPTLRGFSLVDLVGHGLQVIQQKKDSLARVVFTRPVHLPP